MKKRIGLYVRVSTNGQCGDSQEAELRDYCSRRDDCQIVSVYSDVISGVTDQRQELHRLRQDVVMKKIDLVLIYDLSRLGRNLRHCIEILEELKTNNVGLVSIKESLDTGTFTGILIFQILCSLSQFERNKIAERCQLGREFARKNGKIFGRPTNVNDQTGDRIRSLKSQGVSIKKISRELRIGVPTVYRFINSEPTLVTN